MPSGSATCGTERPAPKMAFTFWKKGVVYLKTSSRAMLTAMPAATATFAPCFSRCLSICRPMNQLKTELKSKSKTQIGSPQA